MTKCAVSGGFMDEPLPQEDPQQPATILGWLDQMSRLSDMGKPDFHVEKWAYSLLKALPITILRTSDVPAPIS